MFKNAQQHEVQYESAKPEDPTALLGGGADIAGRLVEYWGVLRSSGATHPHRCGQPTRAKQAGIEFTESMLH